MASFLEQLEHAEMLLQTYRCPELEDVLTLLDTVLQAELLHGCAAWTSGRETNIR